MLGKILEFPTFNLYTLIDIKVTNIYMFRQGKGMPANGYRLLKV